MRHWALVFVIVAAVTLVFSSCGKPVAPETPPPTSIPTPEPSPLPTPTPAPSPTPQPTPTVPPEVEKSLVVLSHSTYVDKYGYFHLVGEVQNLGNRNTEQNRVCVDFYDEQGATYATASGECYREIILSGEKSPFEIVFPKAPEARNYKLTAEGQVTNEQPDRKLLIRKVKSATDADGYYVVTGEIVNQEEHAIENVMLLGTFYDSSGKVVAVSFSFPDTVPIRPGNSSTFVLAAGPNTSSTIDKFSLQPEYAD